MKHILIYIIGFCRRYLSAYKLSACKYYPSCSEYATEAIKQNGAMPGLIQALWRLLRCNPFSRGGYDPVTPPPTFKLKLMKFNGHFL